MTAKGQVLNVGVIPSIQKGYGNGGRQILTLDPKAFLEGMEANLRREGWSKELWGERSGAEESL